MEVNLLIEGLLYEPTCLCIMKGQGKEAVQGGAFVCKIQLDQIVMIEDTKTRDGK